MEDTQTYNSPIKCVSIKKKSESNEEILFPNIQFDNNNINTSIKSENYCKMELDLNWNEEDNVFPSRVCNDTHKYEDSLEAQAQQQITCQEAAHQLKQQEQESIQRHCIQQTEQNPNSSLGNVKIVGNEMKITNIDTHQLANKQFIHIPAEQAMLQSAQPISLAGAQVQQINLIPTLALSSTTSQQNGMMLQSAFIQSIPLQMISGFGYNDQITPVVQATVQPQQLLILQTIQSNAPQRTQQPQPNQQQQVRVHKQAPKISQESQHNNVSSASSERRTKTTKQKSCRVSCTCPNCSNRDYTVTSKRLHICHIFGCGKTYRCTTHLRSHLRMHTGERPFTCTWESCNKTFTRTDALRRHLLIHTKDKLFQCSFCNIKFQRIHQLDKHVKIHTEISNTVSHCD